MILRFLDTGACPPAWNMALDTQLALGVQAGLIHPTLRVYAWQPYAISLGYHQNEEEFDRARLEREGIEMVRRPTGGRAIYHAQELTYSVVVPADPMGPREIYRWINIGLLRGLELLGIRPTLAQTGDPLPQLYRQPTSVPCFASSARSEIQVDGKKIVGSAQRRYGTAVLQHGSILLGPEHRSITKFLAPSAEPYRREMESVLLEKTIDAGTVLRRVVEFDEAAAAVRQGFTEALGVSFIDSTVHDLLPRERGVVSALMGDYE